MAEAEASCSGAEVKDEIWSESNAFEDIYQEAVNICRATNSTKIWTCNLCNEDFVSSLRLSHLRTHSLRGFTPCTLCFKRQTCLPNHLIDVHGVPDIPALKQASICFEFIDYTSLAERIIRTERTKKQKIPKLLITDDGAKSSFIGTDYYVVNRQEAEFDESVDVSKLLIFSGTAQNGTKNRWKCFICKISREFLNDISMRMFALEHLAREHLEGYQQKQKLSSLIDDEWEFLRNELNYDFRSFAEENRFRNAVKSRSAIAFYTESTDGQDELSPVIAEMSRKSDFKILGKFICLICFDLINEVTHHFRKHHNYLKAKLTATEFEEVSVQKWMEPLNRKNLPLSLFYYFSFYRRQESSLLEKEYQSSKIYAWKCRICDSFNANQDVFCEYPSSLLLRMNSLRHFETAHHGFFSEEFLNFEWKVLEKDAKADFDLRTYTPELYTGKGKFDETDPNDYILPQQKYFLPKSLEQYKVCGFCYQAMHPSKFEEHISEKHGYVDHGIELYDNSHRFCAMIVMLRGSHRLKKLPQGPVNILEAAGRQFRNHINDILEVDEPNMSTNHAMGSAQQPPIQVKTESVTDPRMHDESKTPINSEGSVSLQSRELSHSDTCVSDDIKTGYERDDDWRLDEKPSEVKDEWDQLLEEADCPFSKEERVECRLYKKNNRLKNRPLKVLWHYILSHFQNPKVKKLYAVIRTRYATKELPVFFKPVPVKGKLECIKCNQYSGVLFESVMRHFNAHANSNGTSSNVQMTPEKRIRTRSQSVLTPEKNVGRVRQRSNPNDSFQLEPDSCLLPVVPVLDPSETINSLGEVERIDHKSSTIGDLLTQVSRKMDIRIAKIPVADTSGKCGKNKKRRRELEPGETPKGFIPCNHCEFNGCKSNEDVDKHMRSEHLKEFKMFIEDRTCSLCDEQFDNRRSFFAHVTSFHSDVQRPYSCNSCSKMFGTEKNLLYHEKKSHKQVPEVVRTCLKCRIVFETKSDFLRHSKECQKSAKRRRTK